MEVILVYVRRFHMTEQAIAPKLLSDMMHENMAHVKKFLLVPIISGLLISLMSFAPARPHHRLSEVQDSSEVTVQDDSILPVIAWFSKRDTMTYWIHDNDGWPQEVVSQNNISLGDRQKLKQKYITWDYRSVGHSE